MKSPRKSSLSTVSEPKQARSENTLARLLDAAEALIAARGVADVSVADVARRARSSVGGFYARFKDKDELLRALHERRLVDVERRLEALEALASREEIPLAELVHVALAGLVEEFRASRSLLAAFVAHAAHGPKAWARSIEHRRRVVSRIAALFHRRHEAMRPGTTARDVEFVVQVAFSLADAQALYGGVPLGGGPLSDEEMAERLERLAFAYLGIRER